MPPKSQDKYTDPELREEVKEEVKAGDKGGQPGQWSARKAQLMASEYKKRGGGYITDKKDADPSQKHIQQWNDEEWQTRDGSGTAKQEDGTEKRYLPKKAWENMTEEDKDETEKRKQDGSKAGQQFVANTKKAAEERGNVSKAAEKGEVEEEEDEEDDSKTKGKSKKAATPQKTTPKSKAAAKDSKAKDKDDADDKPAQTGQKRNTRSSGPAEETAAASSPPTAKKQKTNSSKASHKKSDGSKTFEKDEASPKKSDDKKKSEAKSDTTSGNDDGTVGTKHDPAEPPAPAGSADRLPKEGQTVHWKSFAGYIEGEVVDVTGSGKDVRIVLKSSKSGKEAVHKPEACFY